MRITNLYGPNTTVLLPGSCDAACGFCFWDREGAKIRPPVDYLDKVFKVLEGLPRDFKVLSISGGEPTISPYFEAFISRLSLFRRGNKFKRVVLTTHGGHLKPLVSLVGCAVDHINISRHSIDDKINQDIFKSRNVPSTAELESVITLIHKVTPCSVTLNCVISDQTSEEFCNSFITYAINVGADAVSFRKEASTPEPTEVEGIFRAKYRVLEETVCPVCRGMVQEVNGFIVRWKGSVMEPSLQTGGVYECVVHPDGKAYVDWGMTTRLPLSYAHEITPPAYLTSGGGCGASNTRSSC